jgi:transglutaminase-like putative cysteine protease
LLSIALAAAVVAVAWLRLEQGRPPLGELLLVLALAVAPALALLLLRGRLGWIGAAVCIPVSALIAAWIVFEVPPTDARRGERDFFGPVYDRMHDGFLDFYDTVLPFNRIDFPFMHDLVLAAIFGFTLVAALLLAARVPLAAGLVVIAGAGWPTTLYPGARPLVAGAVALAAVLGILYLTRPGARGARGLGAAIAIGVVLVAVAVGVSTQNAVAKQPIVGWQGWDLYDAPQDAVGVRYVWNSHYQGIVFPKKETVVLRVDVEGGESRKLYWRATTLDEYTGVGWREALRLSPARRVREIDELGLDPLLPEKAADEDGWVRQDVEVGALADNHLIASAQPVRWRPGTTRPVRVADGGVVVLSRELRPGQRYTVWSFAPSAKPAELVEVKGFYGPELRRYLEFVPGVRLPAFGASDREAKVERIFEERSQNFLVVSHEPVYDLVREVVGGARSPYAAALALESWFREQGGFVYEEQPPGPSGAEPPLVSFLLRSREGYCQHYAGAMAMMLRLLGVPARVAAGFTNGTYDEGSGEWVVTDHNAHTWVEVYFPGFGWLPFDPTPGRGELTAAYSAVSAAFAAPDLAGARQALGSGAVLDAITAEALRRRGVEGVRPDGGAGGAVLPSSSNGGGSAGVVLIGVAVAAALIGALFLAKELRRRLRFATRDPRAIASACRRDVVGFLADQRIDAAEGATLEELGELVEREFVIDAGPFVSSASIARYGRPEDSADAAGTARREERRLIARIRSQLGFPRRARGLFRLRSLAT